MAVTAEEGPEAAGAEQESPSEIVAREPSHDPEQVASQLAAKLAARSRHVSLFIGAGAGKSAGLPDLAELQSAVLATLDGDDATAAKELLTRRDLEAGLTRLRRIASLLEGGEEFGRFTRDKALALEQAITGAVATVITNTHTDLDAHLQLAAWAASASYHLPLEVFTVNYDLLLERAFEQIGLGYFDGFVGNLEGRFRADLVDAVDPTLPDALPGTFVRLWKLHGSINWAVVTTGNTRRIVRLGVPAPTGSAAAIYPSEEKYDASRRLPYVALMDRLRRALQQPESLTVICGYSFRDQHINEVIFDAALRHPRSETVGLCYGDIPAELGSRALLARNMTVFGAEEAIVGGQRLWWSKAGDIPGVFAGGRFLLGDFRHAAAFLGRDVAGTPGAEHAGA
jgi:hypothetical protein